jgi:hypothetical protein
MLVFVKLKSFLRGAHAHPWLNVDIVVNTGYIGIRMMDDIMFAIPDKAIASKNIQGECGHHIGPFMFTETTMGAIMHYIKSDGGNNTAEQNTFADCQQRDGCEKNKVDIQAHKRNTQYKCFEIEIKISGRSLSHLFKIGIDPFFKVGVECVWTGRKFRYLHEKSLLLKPVVKLLHF